MIKQYTSGTWAAVDKCKVYKSQDVESALPLTMLGDGEALTDYKLYGNTVGERTENLFSENMIDPQNDIYIDDNGRKAGGTSGVGWKCTVFVHVVQNSMYTFDPHSTSGTLGRHCFYDKNYTFISAIGSGKQTFTTPSGCEYMKFSFRGISYDITLVEGSTAPSSYIPYGYKLPMVVRSENLFDKSFEQGYYGAGDGVKGNSPRYVRSNDKIPVLSDETYTVTYICPKEGVPQSGVGTDSYIYFWAADSSYIRYQQIMEKGNQTFVTPSNAAYVGFTIGAGSGGSGTLSPSDVSNFMLNSGAAALPYQPYSHTDIPIYIGDTPLAEDEYVDYGTQKIYKDIDGTLTPTDPPVPIPALPTIEGETVYDCDLTVKPSNMEAEADARWLPYTPKQYDNGAWKSI